jgi:hypothetical protein
MFDMSEYYRERAARRAATFADPDAARQRARKLRGQGLSYAAIAKEMAISDSTARLWCNDDAAERDKQRRRDKYEADWPRGRDRMRERRAASLDRVWEYLKRCDESTPPEHLDYRHIARECGTSFEVVAKVYDEFCWRIVGHLFN